MRGIDRRKLGLFLTAAITTQLAGCWFVFIPGSLIKAVGDGITGAEGEHCVGRSAKVGDRITLPDGRTLTVKSLSGTSVYCTREEHPIRAALQ